MTIRALDANTPIGPRRPAVAAPAPAATPAAAGDTFRTSGAYRHLRGLTPAQKHRAEALTSLFENSTLDLQYGYTEVLNDGRGITAGRAGFTSATGDMLEVIRDYTAQVPGNPLARYIPRLAALDKASKGKGSLVGLEGLEAAWQQAAHDPRFRRAQDAVVDKEYFGPAMDRADALGVKSPLGRAVLYDTDIQHGDGDDPDSLGALVAATNRAMGGSPAEGVDEHAWVQRFLAVRRADLAHAHDPSTREAWAESVDRVDVLAGLANAGNWNLDGPLDVTVYGTPFRVP